MSACEQALLLRDVGRSHARTAVGRRCFAMSSRVLPRLALLATQNGESTQRRHVFRFCVFFYFFFAIRFKLGPVRHCVQTCLDPTPNHPTCLQKVSLATSRPLIISWSELQWGRDKASDEVAWLTCFAWVDLNHTIKLIHAGKNKYGRLSRASQVTSC